MRLIGFLIVLFFLASCSSTQASDPLMDTPNPDKDGSDVIFPTVIPNAYSPQPIDSSKIRGNFMMDKSTLNIMESYPIQVSLSLSGSLPTPCHELRVDISQPDQQFKIQIEVYTVLDPEMMCAQVIKPIEVTIPMGSFPTGKYSVWINGDQIGEFDS
ncbi:MAG TPA: hypothetical protein VJZ78_02465 [Anaerolineales bacterium]|nr:hypothetical protein [Anaerolineales bacterium]